MCHRLIFSFSNRIDHCDNNIFFLFETEEEGHSITTKQNPHRGSWHKMSANDGTSPTVAHIDHQRWQKMWRTLCSAFVSNGAPMRERPAASGSEEHPVLSLPHQVHRGRPSRVPASFWIGSLFVPSCLKEDRSINVCRVRLRFAWTSPCAPQCDVDGQLSSVKARQILGQHLNATVRRLPRHGHSCPWGTCWIWRVPLLPGRFYALDGTGALPKSARPWTCCITSRLVDKQRERQPLQQDLAEQVEWTQVQ